MMEPTQQIDERELTEQALEDDELVKKAKMLYALVESKLKKAAEESAIPADVPQFEMW